MSEVGTKLDLARAYVDMGDPEGARSILEEVLKEGNAAHKLEAERLLAGLP
jgi:pilus assembly protein FimV